MANSKKIIFLGGDQRQIRAAERLAEKGYDTGVFAASFGDISQKVKHYESIDEATEGAYAVVLPLPCSRDGVLLNKERGETPDIKLSSILGHLSLSTIIIGGKLPPSFSANALDRGFCVRDYFESENFQIKNAYTTAEAALAIAMNSLSRNIRGSNIAITGYGRISKHLCRLLLGMSAHVTVCARKDTDLAFAESFGCRTVNIGRAGAINELLHGYDVIYNTVPNWIFDRDFLRQVDKETLIIELASAPGGIDICAAKELSSNVSWALSLPGKYAPRSAGELIAECVDGLLIQEARKG